MDQPLRLLRQHVLSPRGPQEPYSPEQEGSEKPVYLPHRLGPATVEGVPLLEVPVAEVLPGPSDVREVATRARRHGVV